MTATGTMSAHAPVAELMVSNLFNTLPDLARMVVSELDREAWLDSFLLTAGLSQLIDDYLQPDPLSLRRATAFFAKDAGSLGRAVGKAITGPGANGIDRLAGARPAAARVRYLQRVVGSSLQTIADRVVDPDIAPPDAAGLNDLRRCCDVVAGSPTWLPRALREDIVRLPACFRSFDQHPDDLRRLVGMFAIAHPDRLQPLLVVGIRTSGSYLAPLYAAYLRAEGYADVGVFTMRPGRRPHARERDTVRSLAARGGLALLCDDPPGTGSSVARVAAELQGLGVPSERLILLLALFGDAGELPSTLTRYESMILGFGDWSIHRRVSPAAVRDAVGALLGPEHVVETAERVRLRVPQSGRGHLRAVFELTVAQRHTGRQDPAYVSVEGVGLGYFGNHAVAVAQPLRDYLPGVLGVRDGLLFREWMPDSTHAELLPSHDRPAMAARIAEYVFMRNRRLGLDTDVTLRQGGQYPAWEATSTLLSRSCGPAWPVGRTLLTDRAVKRLLRVANPSVIDGRVELSNWFAEDGPETMVKVDWDQGSSWNLGLGCCDPVFDLAGATAMSRDVLFGRDLRRAYEALQGESIDEERWLLYQLAHLTAGPEARGHARHALSRACASAMQSYFGRVYFDDLVPDEAGPLCGIDIDGVLETEYLGFPSLTPASAGGLRALLAHGFRPVIASGRSLGDVIERCHAYRLAGGVAEYGSATYVSRDRVVAVLTRPDEQASIERLRSELHARDGIGLDENYTHAIRAFVRDERGTRGPLPEELVGDAQRAAAAETVILIVGDRQTDVVGHSVDKGRAMRALAAAVTDPAAGAVRTPLAFAVGDTAADISLLALAEQPFAPAHATQSLGPRVAVTRRPYQAGFAEAVGRLIGHAPGACARCQLRAPSPERRLLLGLLGLRETGIGRLPLQLMKVRAAMTLPERPS